MFRSVEYFYDFISSQFIYVNVIIANVVKEIYLKKKHS